MGRTASASLAPVRLRQRVRRVLRRLARIRGTRAWPFMRPFARPAYRLVSLIVGRRRLWRLLFAPAPATRPAARTRRPTDPPAWVTRQVDRYRRRLLNLGLTERALVEMHELTRPGKSRFLRRLIAGELALYYADQYRPAEARLALEYLQLAAAGERNRQRRRNLAVLAAECHHRAGDLASAEQALAAELAADDPDPDVLLAAANLEAEPERRAAWLNRALAHYGLAPVALGDGASGATIDRLTGSGPPPAGGRSGPTVTVIVPAYQAADTIGTALDALCRQTWKDLEILVVDDASTDDTAEIVAGYATRDPRIRLIRAEHNRGTYVARNLALREAAGEFVTCHDTDDWSHPEKIERQVQALLADPDQIANTSQHVRATPDLTFHRRGKPGYFLFANMSSLMFRRVPVMESLGYWDSVRFGADSDLQRRIIRIFGEEAFADLQTGPLCLQRQRADSLTGDSTFGYHGFFMGARREYFESSSKFQREVAQLRYEFPQKRRPFPVPAPMLPEAASPAGKRRHFDVIIASDFRLLGGSTMSSLEEITAHRRLDLRTGLIQMAFYGVDPSCHVAGKLRDMIDGDHVQMIVHGERVSCDLLIVRYPPVLQDWQRYVPDVEAEHVRVIVNQPPMSDYGSDAAVRYRLASCQQHLERYFGQPGVWHPIGPLVRQALHEHHADELPAIDLSDEDWVNIIDVDAWRRPSRPSRGPRIRIGRHSRDHPLKWADTPTELRAVYPDEPGRYEVRVLGGVQTPVEILGHLPENWRSWEFDELSPASFLAELDVFVYYPNPRWVESFGRVILEAMAAGVPVVLPPVFQPLFGDSAIYAAPTEVLARVDELMEDDDYYSARADLAQRFVEKCFGHSRHIERIGKFVGQNQAHLARS